MGHLEKHDALSPLPLKKTEIWTWKCLWCPENPSPPHQKYLENVKKVKKTTKSAIFLVIYYMYILQIFIKIADFVVFFTFFAFSRYFWRGGERGERASCFSRWSMLIANYLYHMCVLYKIYIYVHIRKEIMNS